MEETMKAYARNPSGNLTSDPMRRILLSRLNKPWKFIIGAV